MGNTGSFPTAVTVSFFLRKKEKINKNTNPRNYLNPSRVELYARTIEKSIMYIRHSGTTLINAITVEVFSYKQRVYIGN